jgi:peptidyl-prolyl cis-trans isomerase B (cyclophilin B)
VAPTRSRQRKLARDKYERQMVRRAHRQRRRRQIQAAIGAAVILAVVVVGVVWLTGGFEREPEPAVADDCLWLPQEGDPNRLEAGTPPGNPATTGVRTATLALDAGSAGAGEVELALTVDADPCAVASLEYLAAQGFYNGTTCHELAFGALRCGDPTGTGVGGPAYTFWPDNVPSLPPDEDGTDNGEPPLIYPAGTVAFGDSFGSAGSQFLIFYEDFHTDEPLWSIIGEVTSGMALLEAVAQMGTAEESTAPAEQVRVEFVAVVDPEGDEPPALDES